MPELDVDCVEVVLGNVEQEYYLDITWLVFRGRVIEPPILGSACPLEASRKGSLNGQSGEGLSVKSGMAWGDSTITLLRGVDGVVPCGSGKIKVVD